MYLTQYWDSPEIPDEIAALLATAAATNPGLEHRCFDRRSADRFIASRFSARESAAFRACAVPAMQADYFRYCAVLADGGFYLDADSRSLAPLEPLLEGAGEGVLFRRENANVVNGLFAFREPASRWLGTVLELATLGIERRISESVWTTTGPGIFTYLHLLSRMTPAERAHLDYDFIGPDVTASIRLCQEVAAARHGADLDHLFDGLSVLPFERLGTRIAEVDLRYKQGPAHWPNWEGSIFASPPGFFDYDGPTEHRRTE